MLDACLGENNNRRPTRPRILFENKEEYHFDLPKGVIVSVVDVEISPDLRNASIYIALKHFPCLIQVYYLQDW